MPAIEQTEWKRLRRNVLRRSGRYRSATLPAELSAAVVGEHPHPCVYPKRDNTPPFDRGGLVITDSSPESFHPYARAPVQALRARRHAHRLAFVKSWNESVEGNHLEPELEHGHGFLRVFDVETS